MYGLRHRFRVLFTKMNGFSLPHTAGEPLVINAT